MSRVTKVVYSFGFRFQQHDAEKVSEELFKLLGNPSKVKEIIGSSAVYDRIWGAISFADEDHTCYNYNIMKYQFDIDYESKRGNDHVVGFEFHEELGLSTLRGIYKDLFEPLLKSIHPDIQANGNFISKVDFINTMSTKCIMV